MTQTTIPTLPFLTQSLPGIGGDIKTTAKDFIVEELPAYPFSGSGSHTLIQIEKTGISTTEAARRIARALGLRDHDAGYAGHKDARAITRQWLSFPNVNETEVWPLKIPGLKILDVTRHKNRLKTGHLSGNKFSIVLRNVCPEAMQKAQAILDVLVKRGAPNFFGCQRFGQRNNSDLVGAAMVGGDAAAALKILLGSPTEADPEQEARSHYESNNFREALAAWSPRDHNARKALKILASGGKAEQALRAWPKRLRFLFVSACQSRAFNEVLSRRLNSIDSIEDGDLAYLHRNGAVFRVEDALTEMPRVEAFEISPSGPMFGYKMLLAAGKPGLIETEILNSSRLELENFKCPMALKARGERRSLRLPLLDATLSLLEEAETPSLCLEFSLPPGSFATSVVREFSRNSD
jgi:tRNA pseudouridine13 synthase